MSSTTANASIALNHEDVATLIELDGKQTSYIIEGTPGVGKTKSLVELAERMNMPCTIVHCQTLMIGDLGAPVFEAVEHKNGISKVTTFAPKKSLGMHQDRPIFLILDELDKANAVGMAILAPILEDGRIDDLTLPEGSITVATCNLSTDRVSVGKIPAHLYNRCATVRLRGANAEEAMAFYMKKGLPAAMVAFCKTPEAAQMFAEYVDIGEDKPNKFIFDPRRGQVKSFFSSRSFCALENMVGEYTKTGTRVSRSMMQARVYGGIGEAAGSLFMAFLDLGSKLPTFAEVLANPKAAAQKAAAVPGGSFLLALGLAQATKDEASTTACLTMLSELGQNECTLLFGRSLAARRDSASAAARTGKLWGAVSAELAAALVV